MKKRFLTLFRSTCLVLLISTGWVGAVCVQDCASAYYHMKPNTTFTLATYNPKNKLLSSATHVFKSVNKTNDGLKAEVEMELFSDTDKSVGKSNYAFNCSNGTIKLDTRDFAFQDMPAIPNSNMNVEVSGNELELPATLRAGQDLGGASFNIKATMGQVKFMDRNFSIKERKVEGKETVETPAGTFECYKVSYLTDITGRIGKVKTLKTIAWYAKEPGMVRNESYDEKGKMTGYTLLTKYSK